MRVSCMRVCVCAFAQTSVGVHACVSASWRGCGWMREKEICVLEIWFLTHESRWRNKSVRSSDEESSLSQFSFSSIMFEMKMSYWFQNERRYFAFRDGLGRSRPRIFIEKKIFRQKSDSRQKLADWQVPSSNPVDLSESWLNNFCIRQRQINK